jgi:acyl carrier protein
MIRSLIVSHIMTFLRRQGKRATSMSLDSIRQFIIDSLRAMNYDVAGIGDDTELGPRGADLESLALAELAIRVEDEYALRFGDDEAEKLAVMTVGEFCQTIAARISPAPAAG